MVPIQAIMSTDVNKHDGGAIWLPLLAIISGSISYLILQCTHLVHEFQQDLALCHGCGDRFVPWLTGAVWILAAIVIRYEPILCCCDWSSVSVKVLLADALLVVSGRY